MTQRLPNLSWLRTFEAAARLLNFTAAGKELGLTQTAVSLQIKSLETKLGCDLFLRRPRRLALTEMGKAYLPPVRKALEDLTLSTNGLFGPDMKRTITVRAPISTAILWLAPRLHRFHEAHPGIGVRLISTIWAEAIADDAVDVDLRLGHGDWPDLRAEQISTETIVPICARDVASSLRTPGDLLRGRLIHILGFEDNWSQYFASCGVRASEESYGLSVDTSAAALELVAAGCGFATLLTRFADSAIASGRPIAKAGRPFTYAQSHYLLEGPGKAGQGPDIAAFKSWLRACFGAS